MKKMITATAITLSLVTLLAAQPCQDQGQGRGQGRGQGQGYRYEQFKQELQLTEDQESQLKALREKQWEGRDTHRSEMKAQHDQLDKLLAADKVDQKAVDKLIDEIGNDKKEQMKKRVDHLLEVKKILTPEQFEKYLAHRENRAKQGKGRGKGQGKGNGPRTAK